MRTAAVVAVPLVESFLPAALALVLRALVNATLDDGAGGGWSIETYVGISFALSFGLALTQSAQLYLTQSNSEALEHQLALDVMRHAETLEFSRFEEPSFQDVLKQVRKSPGHHTHEMVAKCVRSLAMLVTLSTLLGILAVIEPLLLVFLLPLAVPYLVYRSWVARNRYDVQFAQNRSRRWIDYYTRQATAVEVLPEVRALDLVPFYLDRASDRLDGIRGENVRSFRLEFAGTAAFNTLAVFVIHIAMLAAANRALDGELTPGDIAIFAGAATGLRGSIDAFVAGMGSLRWHLAHLEALRSFFGIASDRRMNVRTTERAGTDAPAAAPLELRDLTFTYPASERPVLDGVSFTVNAGETVGLVGRNGSGKSTIVKLVNGLYLPDSGSLSVGGVDIGDASREYLHEQLSTVFQHVVQHNATASENIAMGDWRALLERPDVVEQIARRVGLDALINSLRDGYDTDLGRVFGDVTLSGGQWQKFAIARAFAKTTPLMILDEPTASLDPEAEFEVFEQFNELADGRATLLISHRFTTLALADRIVVLNDGRADEQGSHEELLEIDGTYAHLHRLFRTRGESGIWDDSGSD